MSRGQSNTRGLLALVLGAVCIGFAPIWVRWSEVGPVATAFYRVGFALPMLALWAARERHGFEGRFTSADRACTIAAGVCFALDLAAWHLSIRFTSVANATLLANFAPIFVTIGAWLFLSEPVSRRFVAGMALGLSGAWLLTGASLATDPSRLRGDLFALVTALFYGGYQLGVARLRRHQGPGRVLFGSSLVSVPILGLMAVALGERIVPGSGQGWLVLAGLALTAQALGQGLITYGFAHLPAGYSSLTLLVQPLVAVVAGWLLLGESLGSLQILGAAILVGGLVIAGSPVAGKPESTEKPPPASPAAGGHDPGPRPSSG